VLRTIFFAEVAKVVCLNAARFTLEAFTAPIVTVSTLSELSQLVKVLFPCRVAQQLRKTLQNRKLFQESKIYRVILLRLL
jgi:hypothetical protein